ncbi:MAG: Polysaccharide biosynthesis/export protein [Chthoniobacteraceae bacterium]|nr:Polysaccharide biosynthesis/export protein [Chthoniobacteraceae bacterium]
MRKFVFHSLSFVLAFSSIHAQTVRRAAPSAPAPTRPAAAAADSMMEGAVFRASDSFELRMSGMPPEDALPFAQQFTIGGDGFVNIPLGGQVRAAGLTQSQLERAIERCLVDKKIFTRPTATINVAPTARFVTIGGQVRNPQRLPWYADLTLNSAISAAQGAGDFAGNKIRLIRNGKVLMFDKKVIAKDPAQDPHLMPGDQVEHQ